MSKVVKWKVVCLAVAGVALSLLAAKVARADSFSDQAAKLDIVGVHLGMSPAEVKSVLAQHRKGMQWQDAKGDLGVSESGFLVGADANWDALTNIGRESVSVVFSTPPGDPRVLGVSRDVWFQHSQAPTVETLVKSLTEKFGQPTCDKSVPISPAVPMGMPIFVWAWGKTGQIEKPTPGICQMSNGCDSNWVRQGFSSLRSFRSSWWMAGLQKANEGGCAMVVHASINQSQGIATLLRMDLVHAQDALQAAIATDSHLKQVDQAKKEEALKKASANKAPAL